MGLINFLRNIASQLEEFLGTNEKGDDANSEGKNTKNYRDFIVELLEAEQKSNSDVAIIYPMLAQRQHLLNEQFAQILQQQAENLIVEHSEAVESIIADGVTTIGKPLTACGVYRLLSKKKRSAILKKT